MTSQNDKNAALLRALISRFVDHPEALEIARHEGPGSCYWTVKGHPEDEGKLIGTGGSHVKALDFLVRILGRAQGQRFTFRLISEGEPSRRASRDSQAESYEHGPTMVLLAKLLDAFGFGYSLEAFPSPGQPDTLTFVFMVTPRSVAVYRILTVPPEGQDGLTLIESIGCLFRAIARKDGICFHVEVAPLP